MKLYLAIALLVVAFAALTVAQEADQKTVEEKFQEFGAQVSQGFNQFADKAKETFSGIQTSDIATKTQEFFARLLEQAKAIGQ